MVRAKIELNFVFKHKFLCTHLSTVYVIKKKTLYACNDSLVSVENTNNFFKGCLILQLCNNSKKKKVYL